MCDGPDLFLCALSILFPPLGVWVKRGICSCDSLINLILTTLGYVPGLLHAWYIISCYPDPGYEQVRDEEPHVHIYYVRGGPPPPSAGPGPGAHSTAQGGYGTIGRVTAPKAASAIAPMTKPAKDTINKAKGSQQAGSSSGSAPAQAFPSAADPSLNKTHNGEDGPSEGPPPSYSEVVKGDNKIQSHE